MSLSELPPEEEQRLLNASRVQAEGLHRHLAQVLIGAPAAGMDGPVNSGSAILVRLPSGVAVLTANHVIAQYESAVTQDRRVILQIGDIALTTVDRPAFRDDHDDLAMIAVSDQEAERIGTWIHDPTIWPPPVPQEGTFVWLVGYPEALRSRQEDNGFTFASMVSLHRVRSSFLNHFTVELEREFMVSWGGAGIPPSGMNFGGMSGGPAFLMADLHSPLVGIIKEDWPAGEYFVVQGLGGLPKRLG
jgi:hypothetical protein